MSWSRRIWSCPYYKWDDKLRIKCECGRLDFPARKSLERYADRYCSSVEGWSRCTLACSMTEYLEEVQP